MHRTLAVAVTTSIATALLAPVVVLGPAAPAQAQVAGDRWEPVTQPSFTVPAGRYCDFAFSYVPDRQDLERRVLARWPDGTEREVLYRGPLVGTTTNLATGASAQRDSSGTQLESYRRDGTLAAYTSWGTVGLGFTATDRYPRGYYELGGLHRTRVARDGTKTVVVDAGPEEDLCRTLG